ncbi:MAG: hypothetical protein JKY99_11330, partial [Rhizobiales bacterium]|nr:hypothetical protein [Hyphomicrobiales bacterium]
MKSVPDETLLTRYFQALNAAIMFLQRAVVSRDQGPWGARPHDILGAVMTHNLTRLQAAAHSWALQAHYNDRFHIDLSESGFPAFREVLALNEAQKTAKERLKELPDPSRIKRDMIDQMLKSRKMPSALQKKMAERLFFQDLRQHNDNRGVFPPFTKPKTIRISKNPSNGRP